jgi:hypothetical protein
MRSRSPCRRRAFVAALKKQRIADVVSSPLELYGLWTVIHSTPTRRVFPQVCADPRNRIEIASQQRRQAPIIPSMATKTAKLPGAKIEQIQTIGVQSTEAVQSNQTAKKRPAACRESIFDLRVIVGRRAIGMLVE